MIVLIATQDKVLAALQSVAGIVERRNTLPILANVLFRKRGASIAVGICESKNSESTISQIFRILRSQACASKGLQGSKVKISRPIGFFSAVKTNLRNAP